MPNEVLVTGAAGFVGRHVALSCAAVGWRVTGLDIRPVGADILAGMPFLRTDLSDPDVVRMVRDGRFDAVLHHAGISSTTEQDQELLRRVNVTGPLELAAACAQSGTRFVYASSHSVYGNIKGREPIPEDADAGRCSGPLNHYAESKLELDRAMERSAAGAWWVGLRYTNVFGPGEQHKGPMASIISRILRAAAKGKRIDIFANTLAACRDYVAVDIVADVCTRLVTADVESGVYNLGSGIPVSFATLLEWCFEFAGEPITVRLVPNPFTANYQFWTGADTAKLRTALNGDPIVSLADVRRAAERLFEEFRAGRG